MKKIILLVISVFIFGFVLLASSSAQDTTRRGNDNHTAREEVEGKEIWEKLQTKQLEYKNLTNDNFEVLGEYFMGQMTGSSHEAMNNMMTRMMGTEGEKQMHIAMGKRFTGTKGGGNFMMGNFGTNSIGWFGFGWIFMILFWLLIILGVVALVRYLFKTSGGREKKSSLEILKERYAKGEINKKEFEEKKKDLI